MEEKNTAAEVERSGERKSYKWLIAVCIAAVALLAAYLGLCAYANASPAIFRNVSIAGVELGGQTQLQAAETLAKAAEQGRQTVAVTLSYENWSGTLDGGAVQTDAARMAEWAWQTGREHFLTSGFWMAAHTLGVSSSRLTMDAQLSDQGQETLTQLLDQAEQQVAGAVCQPEWSVEEGALVLTQGVTGVSIDRETVEQELTGALAQALNDAMEGGGSGNGQVGLAAEETPPERLDLQAVYDQIYTQPQSAELDAETYEIIPQVTGVSFDVAATQARLDAAAEGQQLTIPLTLTEPEMTTERLEKLLFADVLGECSTTVSGTANRVSNVALAAERCDEYILMPGEVFTYNGVVGPRTTAAGFKPAPAYVNGETVDEVGGGICQVSSTIYLAALRSNLEIVERRNHSYISSYITAGMDATVAYGAIDFKFRNDTDYPIKIVAGVNKRTLSVQILGTKTDNVTVKMTYSTLSTTPAQVVYRADESVPAGTTKVSVTPYTGYKVAVYRNLYDGEGNLISSQQESMNTYSKRDKVILYNPADAASLGLAEGGTAPQETPVPQETPAPQETTPPVETVSPVESAPPTATEQPAPTPSGGAEAEAAPTTPPEQTSGTAAESGEGA